ncbi:serine/threonine-protein kinase [Actinomadura violacea]|uniref:non-specific serine/threonine protein kinase n=1 Tax=Actinomadura violacea TaxID=2819934 RepID=A0ABS3S7X3_9ACTN|nr:serine/threonine-protein kinase [Actinomadura violacea]MBO2465106.1 serine/threonine protein kinase [Actinomadura violacea]
MAQWRVPEFDEVRELGSGAQGRVVLARHAVHGAPVAIKYLTADADSQARARFRDEARMLGRVDDPHVARLYRLVEHGDDLAIVMEAVDGVPFKEILHRYGALEPEAALTVLKGSLLGLAAAHAAGVVHRDYKPANVIVPADGRSRLIDFGIAVVAGESSAAGTPLYMAPEQWRGEPATPATDVYAATCVFYEALTGRRPYGNGDRASIRAGHLDGDVPAAHVPEPLRPLVARGMAKAPADRPASASAFVGYLDEVAGGAYGPDWESRGVRVLAGAAVALAALFPLAAAGLAPAGAAGAAAGAAGGAAGAAGSGGVLAAVGTKAAVAVAATAVAGTAVGGAAAYRAAEPDRSSRPVTAATTARPTPSGVPLSIGRLTLRVPASWRSRRLGLEKPEENYNLTPPGACRTPKAGLRGDPLWRYCPTVLAITTPWSNDGRTGWQTFQRDQPWAPETDVSHICPPDTDLYYGGGDFTLVRKGLRPIGGRNAEYREWRLSCIRLTSGPEMVAKTGVSFVQRWWYLPQSKVLIVDEWNTPNLDEILANATWT